MGKGEIACYKQFLLFPQYFQKACFPGASEGVIVWEWVKGPPKVLVSNNVVSDSRWSLNAGSIWLILEGVLYQNSGLLKQWIA